MLLSLYSDVYSDIETTPLDTATDGPATAALYPTNYIEEGASIQTDTECLRWVDWFHNRRLIEPVTNIPPTEAEALHHAHVKDVAMTA
ncbi:hypothetical protein [Azospirillum brasilense]|uniref:hypothetical protein n=1 Tax=Azospirillum brasilense TaxID=192 RepID=UPI00119F597C|nr:hypothetical protein [Azospirillum brasilense]